MPVNSIDILDGAKALSSTPNNSEFVNRTVVSRAYYGFYHRALVLADVVRLPPLSACVGGTHEKVSGFYRDYISSDRSETRLFRKVGINLLNLHAQRVKADYKLDEEVCIDDAISVLNSCIKLHQEVDVYHSAYHAAHSATCGSIAKGA